MDGYLPGLWNRLIVSRIIVYEKHFVPRKLFSYQSRRCCRTHAYAVGQQYHVGIKINQHPYILRSYVLGGKHTTKTYTA